MSEPFVFDPRCDLCKEPFGAVPCGTAVTFHCRPLATEGFSHCALVLSCEFSGTQREQELPLEGFAGERLCFSGTLTAPELPDLLWYHFRFWREDGTGCLLDKTGYRSDGQAVSWQLTVYQESRTPGWFGAGVTYQIFPDRFCRLVPVDPAGLVGRRWVHEDWDDTPEWRPDPDGEIRNRDFFGGTLAGITSKLDDLKALGVTTLYLCPIFESASNHRYNTADYTRIDPMLGTEADFRALCAQARQRGMRVILDGVFNHTGSQSMYFNADGYYPTLGAAQSQDSPWYSWYRFHHWPDSYDSWWGIRTLPAVEESSPSYVDFIIDGKDSIIRRWLRAGASGWRLDVADELPDVFLDALRRAAKAEKADALVLGEVWEDASNKYSYGLRRRYLLGDQLDSVMNYPFANAVLSFLRSGSSDGFFDTILSIVEHYPPQVLHLLMNHIGTHDTPRALTALAGEEANGRGREWQSGRMLSPEQRARGLKLMRLATAIQYTLPGVPSIYYGDEAGMEGYGDPFNRGCYPWGQEDRELLAWYHRLGMVRRACPALADGEFEPVWSEGGMIAFARNKGSDRILTVINRGDHDYTYALPYDWRAAKGLMGVMPWEGCLTMPPLSCAVLGLGGWMEQV